MSATADRNRILYEVAVEGNADKEFDKIADSVDDLAKRTEKGLGNFEDALKSMKSAAIASAAIVATFALIKKAINETFDAENIRATNQEFEVLAKNVGISAGELRDGLTGAADGLIDDTDLVKQASKSIIEMGSTAKDLPKALEVARKASAVFGGDVAQNFETISQAIATGQTRSLKNLGIIIDQEAAYQKLADTLGVTKDELSEQGKQQAILNAVVESGKKDFEGIDLSLRSGQNTLQQLKVTLGQIEETATLAFDRLAGPTVRAGLAALRDIAASASVSLKASLGEGSEKAAAQVEVLTGKVNEIKATLIDLEQKQKGNRGIDPTPADTIARIQALNSGLKDYTAQLATAQSQLDTFKKSEEQSGISAEDATAKLTQQNSELQKLAEQGVKIFEGLQKEDPNKKYDEELAALEAALAKQLLDQEQFEQGKLQLGIDRDKKLSEIDKAKVEELKSQNDSLREIDAAGNADRINDNQKRIDTILAQEKVSASERLKIEADRVKKQRDIEAQQVSAAKDTFGNIAAAAKVGGQETFEIYKAAAKAQAIIAGYEGVAKAIAKVEIFPLNYVLAASIAAATAAQVVSINATGLATGIDKVPGLGTKDNFPAVLAPGERVVPSKTNQDLTADLEQRERDRAVMSHILAAVSRNPEVHVYVGSRELALTLRDEIASGRVVFST